MPTKNVVVTALQASLIDGLVAAGRYQNASEVMRAGLKMLADDEAKFQESRARLLVSLDQARRREFAQGTIDEIFSEAFEGAVEPK